MSGIEAWSNESGSNLAASSSGVHGGVIPLFRDDDSLAADVLPAILILRTSLLNFRFAISASSLASFS